MSAIVKDRPDAGTAAAEWPVWSTTARLVVTDAGVLDAAHAAVAGQLAAVDRAASRFRPDSEVSRLARAAGRPQRVSPLLAELLQAALGAAGSTGGDVDPTLGGALARLGYDRDISLLAGHASAVRIGPTPAPGWRRLQLDGHILTMPAGVRLDLGATAKAFAADRCARLVADRLGVGVLVSLGGDIATAGPAPDGGWRVRVQDRPGDPQCTVALPAGAAIATSSTVSRQWRDDGRLLHHILDPRTCQPAAPVWRTATVAAYRCVDANTLTTAALVRGGPALGWLRALGVPARLVAADGTVLTTARWPRTETP